MSIRRDRRNGLLEETSKTCLARAREPAHSENNRGVGRSRVFEKQKNYLDGAQPKGHGK